MLYSVNIIMLSTFCIRSFFTFRHVLQERLNNLAMTIGEVGVGFAVVVLLFSSTSENIVHFSSLHIESQNF